MAKPKSCDKQINGQPDNRFNFNGFAHLRTPIAMKQSDEILTLANAERMPFLICFLLLSSWFPDSSFNMENAPAKHVLFACEGRESD